MNWYKKAQSYKNFPTWIAEQINKLPPNNADIFVNEKNLELIQNWITDNNPDLSKYNYITALEKANNYNSRKQYNLISPIEKEEIYQNKLRAESQNYNPNQANFMVDLKAKKKAIPPKIKNKINKNIHSLGNYHSSIPLETIFQICEDNGVTIIDEDGTKWSGMLLGGAECGSDDARNQHVLFHVAYNPDNTGYIPTNNGLSLSWCNTGRTFNETSRENKKIEIVCYLS